MGQTVYENVKLQGQSGYHRLAVENGSFIRVEPMSFKLSSEHTDLEGRLAIAPFVDAHIHLDYVYTAPLLQKGNCSGTLFEGIQRWAQIKSAFTKEEILERGRRAIRAQMRAGVQQARSHVDVTDPKLTGLEAMLELREEVKDFFTLQLVAFPQEGMISYSKGVELVEEALKQGADVVGGIPHCEETREMGILSIRKGVQLAEKYAKQIDFHCDETDDEQSRFLEVLAMQVKACGMGAMTTASHACAMGSYHGAYRARLMKLIRESGIHFAVCPAENLHLQGRGDDFPKRRGVAPVGELLDNGINVCFAQDSIEDPWYPLGSGNLMNVLDIGVHACQLTSPSQISGALDLVTRNAAKAVCIDQPYGFEAGKEASFVVLDAETEKEALCRHAPVLRSVRAGQVLFAAKPSVPYEAIDYLKT